MRLVNNIKKYLSLFIGFLQYRIAAFMRNFYPYKLVGEKRIQEKNNGIIVFRKTGTKKHLETPIDKLLSDYNLVSGFHPEEALKLGFIAFEGFIETINPKERQAKFYEIKEQMLSSPGVNMEKINHEARPIEIAEDKTFSVNKYPCKLVGYDNVRTEITTVIFTICGKRDGYKKNLSELIANAKLLEKFHPTEAVKFGFIYLGDMMFST